MDIHSQTAVAYTLSKICLALSVISPILVYVFAASDYEYDRHVFDLIVLLTFSGLGLVSGSIGIYGLYSKTKRILMVQLMLIPLSSISLSAFLGSTGGFGSFSRSLFLHVFESITIAVFTVYMFVSVWIWGTMKKQAKVGQAADENPADKFMEPAEEKQSEVQTGPRTSEV
eukprot:238044_1